LARVKEQINAIESHKAKYKSENGEIIKTIQKLSGEEVEKAHTDSTLHSQEQSSSKLASRDALAVLQHVKVYRQIKVLDEQMAQTNDKDTKLMLKAKTDVMRDRTWRDQWITKRPWDGAAEY
jgi:hypothetical protein